MFGKKLGFFDGAGYSADEEEDFGGIPFYVRASVRSSSADDSLQLHSPTPISPSKQRHFLATEHERLFSHGIEDIEFTSPLENLLSRPSMPTPVNIPLALPMVAPGVVQGSREGIVSGALQKMVSKLL